MLSLPLKLALKSITHLIFCKYVGGIILKILGHLQAIKLGTINITINFNCRNHKNGIISVLFSSQHQK